MKRIEEVILFQIEQASKASKIYSQREFDRLGIDVTIEQWILLKIISESKGLTQRELALKSSRDPASITRTLDLLAKKGLIARMSVEGNRRRFSIELTKEGNAFIEKYLNVVLELRKKSVAGIPQDQMEILSELLIRIRKNMG